MIRSPRRGFSLIEVVLAIALSAVLLGLLTMAINLFLLRVNAGQAAVEHAQIARGVMLMIAADLRNAATIYEQDVSTVTTLASAAQSFDVDTADQLPEELTASESENTRTPVGLIGESQQLQIDVLRVRPRQVTQPEEMAAPATDEIITPLQPGISTVRYLLLPEGLVRQEVSRDIALWEETQGRSDSWDASQQVVAAEVIGLQFRYSDGEQVVEAWDLEEREGVSPLAVEIQLTLRLSTDEEMNEQLSSQPTNTTQQVETRTYRMMVALPQAIAAEVETDETTSDLPAGV